MSRLDLHCRGGLGAVGELIAQELENLLHAGSGFAGDLEDLHPRTHALDVSARSGDIKVGCLGQIHLGDDCDIGAV